MQDWLKAFHGANQAFPAVDIAVKAAVALALGLLVGFEREWSNKDIGVRTFAMAALLGLLATLLGPPLVLFGGAAILLLRFGDHCLALTTRPIRGIEHCHRV